MKEQPITKSQFEAMVKTDEGIAGWELVYNGITNIVIERDHKRWRIRSNWDGIRCEFLRDTTPPPIQIENSFQFSQHFKAAKKKSRSGVKVPWFKIEDGHTWRIELMPSGNIVTKMVAA